MTHNRIGLLLVTNEEGELSGVLSERDIVAAMASNYTSIDHMPVSDIMTRSVVSVAPQELLVEAVAAMNKHGIRHLVVKEDKKPVGLISIRDVLRAFAEEVTKNGGVTDNKANREFVSALAAYQNADRLSIQI
jgi:CBS domain-containing protein